MLCKSMFGSPERYPVYCGFAKRLIKENMARSIGEIPLSTKVDQPMRQFVEDEAGRLGVSRSEMIRRVLMMYRESRRENTSCNHCGQPVVVDLTEL